MTATRVAVQRHPRQAMLGVMVSCNSSRNPDLLAEIARTVDHISGVPRSSRRAGRADRIPA